MMPTSRTPSHTAAPAVPAPPVVEGVPVYVSSSACPERIRAAVADCLTAHLPPDVRAEVSSLTLHHKLP